LVQSRKISIEIPPVGKKGTAKDALQGKGPGKELRGKKGKTWNAGEKLWGGVGRPNVVGVKGRPAKGKKGKSARWGAGRSARKTKDV